MARRLAWTLTLLGSCTCDRDASAPPPPADPGPELAAWSGPENPGGPGLLPEGALQASVRLSAVPGGLMPAELASIDPDAPITMTLGRPLSQGLHHRIAWTQRPGTSWRDVVPPGEGCPLFDDAECILYADWVAAVITRDEQVRLDLFSRHGLTRSEAQAEFAVSPTGELGLEGQIAARALDVRAALGDPNPPAVKSSTLEVVSEPGRVALRMRWHLEYGPAAEQGLEPAPSWDALCKDAVACLRTGPWPDIAGWLSTLDPVASHDAEYATLALWATAWPGMLARTLTTARARVPDAARGFFDTALAGLGDVAFAGGRLLADGTALAFVRVPSAQVDFTAGVLAWAGLPSTPTMLTGGVEVSWVPLGDGGLVLAVDEGGEPAMGWIAYASSPEAFTWLRTAPRTAAGPSSAYLHVERLDSLPGTGFARLQSWLPPFADHALTLRLQPEDAWLTARVELRRPR